MSAPAISSKCLQDPTEDAPSFWLLLFFTFVLFVAPQSLLPIPSWVHLALVSGGLATILYISSHLAHGRPLSVNRPEYRLILWFVLVAILSIPFSRWPAGSYDSLINRFSKVLVVYFLLGNTVNTVRRMKLMIGVVALSGIVIAVLALYAYARGPFNRDGRIIGYVSPLNSNPNGLALTLDLIMALVLGLYWSTDDLRKRLFLLAVMGLLVGGVIVSFSRGGFLGLMTILGILFFRLLRRRRLRALIPVLLCLLVIPLLLPSGYGTRLYSMTGFAYDHYESISRRVLNMRAALALMLENPFSGVGFDMGELAIGDMLGPDLQQQAHNVYLQIGSDLGIPGLVIYLLLVGQLLKGLRFSVRQLRALRDGRVLCALGQGVEIALLAFLVLALFHPVAYDFYFYYVAGLAVAFQEMADHLFVQSEVSASNS